MKSRIARAVGICVAVAGILAFPALCLILVALESLALESNGFTPMPFDSVVWRNTPSEMSHASLRLRMVDDLLAKHKLRGLTRQDVVALIGEPDKTRYFEEYDMVYHLGDERGFFSIDSEWLVLRLDKDGKVEFVRVARD